MDRFEVEVSFSTRKAGDWRNTETESMLVAGTLEVLRNLDLADALDSAFRHAVSGLVAREDRSAAIEQAIIDAWIMGDEPKTYDQIREELGL
jgi:hypothetical protein